MVAKSMRLAIRDSILIALSVAVIVLAWWPRNGPRQLVHVRGETGNSRSFAIPLGDPRLGEIRQHLFNRAHPRPRTEWVLARWRRRLASHYIAHRSTPQQGEATAETGPSARAVVQASYPAAAAGPAMRGAAASAADEDPANRLYWVRENERAERAIEAEERRFAQQRAAAGMPPVVLGNVVAGQRRGGAWLTALASGLLAAIGFAHWALRWPALAAIRGRGRLGRRQASAGPSENGPAASEAGPTADSTADSTAAVRIEIPAPWIRISQPLPVALRRWAMAGVVLSALSSLWL